MLKYTSEGLAFSASLSKYFLIEFLSTNVGSDLLVF